MTTQVGSVLGVKAPSEPSPAPLNCAVSRFCAVISPPSLRGPIVSGSILAWRRSFPMQPFEMRDHLRLTGPSAEGETQHLIGAFGRRASNPQTDEEASDQGHRDLYPDAVGRLTYQVAAAQHTFDPPEK